ncbi:MAG: hypothetical protein Q9227_009465 [Pyrenula ochraceoflavens]
MASSNSPARPGAFSRSNSMLSRNSQYSFDSDTAGAEDFIMQDTRGNLPALWRHPDPISQKMRNSVVQIAELQSHRYREDTSSESSPVASHHDRIQTLEGELQSLADARSAGLSEEYEVEQPEKTPRPDATFNEESLTDVNSEEEAQPPRVPGVLESEMLSLISKIVRLEEGNPTATFSNEEYLALQARVKELEAEKTTWAARHEALFALRDEDVANLRTVRVLLAEERREHAAMRKLRDDDLINVIKLREQLADKTWKEAGGDKANSPHNSGSQTPPSATRERPKSIFLERRNTAGDMWQAAKLAAMEHRALELERANEDLLAKLKTAQTNAPEPAISHGPQSSKLDQTELDSAIEEVQAQLRAKDASLEDARRENANLRTRMDLTGTENEPRLRSTISDLQAQLKQRELEIKELSTSRKAHYASQSEPQGASPLTGSESDEVRSAWDKVEHLRVQKNRLQETMTRKVQVLRGEKESLLRDLDRKEDEVAGLEGKLDELERALRRCRLA